MKIGDKVQTNEHHYAVFGKNYSGIIKAIVKVPWNDKYGRNNGHLTLVEFGGHKLNAEWVEKVKG